MSESKFYTDRSNARRAAERMIEKGEAPSVDYGLKQHLNEHRGVKYEIIWHTSNPTSDATPPAGAAEQASQDATVLKAEPAIETDPGFAPVGEPAAEPAPVAEPEARPAVQEPDAEAGEPVVVTMAMKLANWYVARCNELAKPGKPKWVPPVDVLSEAERIGKHRVESISRKNVVVFEDGSTMSLDDAPPARQRKALPIGKTTDAKNSAGFQPTDRDAEQQAEPAGNAAKAASRPAATGTTPKAETRASKAAPLAAGPDGFPVKPVITSAANASYQAKFDALEGMAQTGDWDGVEAYQVKGVNTYAKKLANYRAALLAARPAAKTTAA